MTVRIRARRKQVTTLLSGLIPVLALALLLKADSSPALGPVRFKEGLTHGFLALGTLDGEIVAEGDSIEVTHGDRVTSQLRYHFKDGSVHDETTIFSQQRELRLLSYHLVQKGPSFQHPIEMWIDVSTDEVKVNSTDKDGKQKSTSERMALPPDVANGMVLTLLKNIRPDAGVRVSMVAPTPKPRLVHLAITAMGNDPFSLASSSRKAEHYVVKVEIGGLAGLIAPLLGKDVPDTHVWILGGEAPTFVKSEGPLCMDCPVWRVELARPVWPSSLRPDSNGESKH